MVLIRKQGIGTIYMKFVFRTMILNGFLSSVDPIYPFQNKLCKSHFLFDGP